MEGLDQVCCKEGEGRWNGVQISIGTCVIKNPGHVNEIKEYRKKDLKAYERVGSCLV